MTEDEFTNVREYMITALAEDNIEGDVWRADNALQKSREALQSMLPDGLGTENTFLFTLKEPSLSEVVGFIYLMIEGVDSIPFVHISYLEIYGPYQRKGYGAQTLQAVEAKAREMGIANVGLHVFGYNTGARALYEKLGYQVGGLYMRKKLSSDLPVG
jgi:ribosomal protein S18 acetylase RimI-like enzyme